MPNVRLKDWEDALVTAISGAGISNIGEIRAVTPLDINGILRYARPILTNGNGVYITTSEEPYEDLDNGGDSRTYDVQWFTDIIVLSPIRDDAISAMRDDIMAIADGIRDAIINDVLLTSPFRAFPVGMRASTQYRSHDQGFVSVTLRVYSGMQFNG